MSYRRADTQEIADLLYARLAGQFGASDVFMDRADIEHGQRWREEVTRQIVVANMFVVLIGPSWLETLLKRAEKDDVLRSELTSALEHKKQIIPVLIDGTPMPHPAQLPPELRALTDYQALPLTHDTLDRAMLGLLGRLKPGWALGVSWGFGQLFGWLCGILILIAALAGFGWMEGRKPIHFAATYPFLAAALAGALAGACVAAPQWLLLKPWFERARYLLPAYIALSALAAGVGASIASGDDANNMVLGFMIILLPVAFAATLWWVLSDQLIHAGWWSAANLVAPLVGMLIAANSYSNVNDAPQRAEDSKLAAALDLVTGFFLPVILMSLAVGYLLVWLMCRSEIKRR